MTEIIPVRTLFFVAKLGCATPRPQIYRPGLLNRLTPRVEGHPAIRNILQESRRPLGDGGMPTSPACCACESAPECPCKWPRGKQLQKGAVTLWLRDALRISFLCWCGMFQLNDHGMFVLYSDNKGIYMD